LSHWYCRRKIINCVIASRPWFQPSTVMLKRSALFWGITQHRGLILYRRFGTTYRSHLQGSRSPRRAESRQEKHAVYVGRGAGGETHVSAEQLFRTHVGFPARDVSRSQIHVSSRKIAPSSRLSFFKSRLVLPTSFPLIPNFCSRSLMLPTRTSIVSCCSVLNDSLVRTYFSVIQKLLIVILTTPAANSSKTRSFTFFS
jgi:hypothetical protein